jgi:hypothetical protein
MPRYTRLLAAPWNDRGINLVPWDVCQAWSRFLVVRSLAARAPAAKARERPPLARSPKYGHRELASFGRWGRSGDARPLRARLSSRSILPELWRSYAVCALIPDI